MYTIQLDTEHGEPTEFELIEEEPEEALNLLIEKMLRDNTVPAYFYAEDSLTEEQLELDVQTYLTSRQIDYLVFLFARADGFTKIQLEAIIEGIEDDI